MKKKFPNVSYKKFFELKGEIEEKIKIIKSANVFPINQLKPLIAEAELALMVFDEKSHLLSLFQTHIFSIVALLNLAKQKIHVPGIDELIQKIFAALNETHSVQFENPTKIIGSDLCHSLLGCFHHVLKIYPIDKAAKNHKYIRQLQYFLAMQAYDELKSRSDVKNTKVEIDLFAIALPIIANIIAVFTDSSKTNSYYARLEDQFYNIHCQIYTLYDKHVKLLLPQIEVLYYHLLYQFKLNNNNIPELVKLCREFCQLDDVNEFYQYKKFIALQTLINGFKDYFTLQSPADFNPWEDLLLENMLVLVAAIVKVFDKIPNEFYLVNKLSKINYYRIVVCEVISTCTYVLSNSPLTHEDNLFSIIENIIFQFNEIIKKNHATELDEKDSKQILDIITHFIKTEQLARNSFKLIPHLKYYANIFTNKTCSPDTLAIRDHIINYTPATVSAEGLMLVSPIQLKDKAVPKLKTFKSKLIGNFASMKKQLLELKSAEIKEFEQKAHLNFKNTLAVINTFEKNFIETKQLQPLPILKLSSFFLKVLSGFEGLNSGQQPPSREKELIVLEEILDIFATHSLLEKSHWKCYQLQLFNYLSHKKSQTGKVIECIDKMILTSYTDITAHQAFIEIFLETSVKYFNVLNTPAHQLKLTDSLFKLVNKYMHLGISQLELTKSDYENKSLVTKMSLNVLSTAGIFNYLTTTLFEKLFHIIFSFKISLISTGEHLKILDTIDNIFKTPHFFNHINPTNLNALVSLVKLFYRENLNSKHLSFEPAFAQSESKKDILPTGGLVTDLRVKSKDREIERLKQKLNLIKQRRIDLQHHLKEKKDQTAGLMKRRQESQVKQQQIEQKFLKNKNELLQKQREHIEKLKLQHQTKLAQLRLTQNRRLEEKLKEKDKLKAVLFEKENRLKLTQEQLSSCQAQIFSQELILSQYESPDSKFKQIQKNLDDSYKGSAHFESEINKNAQTLETTQTLIQSCQEQIIQAKARREFQQNQLLEQVEHSKFLTRELKKAEENRKADQIAFTKAHTSLQNRRNELLKSWRPNFVYSQPETAAPSSLLYYTPSPIFYQRG